MGSTELKIRGIDLNDLTDKHRAFVVEYCKHYNATKAAKVAGYKNPSVIGRRLIDGRHHPKVARAIGAIQRKNLETAIIAKDEILEILSCMARADVVDLCDEDGTFIVDDVRKLPKKIRRAIESIDVAQRKDAEGNVVSQTFKVKLSSKLSAIDKLMSHYGMNAPQEHHVEHSLSWDQLYEDQRNKPKRLDVIEGKIARAERGEVDEE